MPEFGNAFSGLASKSKLTHSELVRSIRFMVAAEYEAIQLYEQLADSTDCTLARKVLQDIANEEKEHAGEFLRLLKELAPEDEEFYREGMEETEEAIAELHGINDSHSCYTHREEAAASCRCSDPGQKSCACEESKQQS